MEAEELSKEMLEDLWKDFVAMFDCWENNPEDPIYKLLSPQTIRSSYIRLRNALVLKGHYIEEFNVMTEKVDRACPMRGGGIHGERRLHLVSEIPDSY
jgi:hypothetical protein